MKYQIQQINRCLILLGTIFISACSNDIADESIGHPKSKKQVKDKYSDFNISLYEDSSDVFFIPGVCENAKLLFSKDSLLISFCLNQKPERGFYSFIDDTAKVIKLYKRVWDEEAKAFATDEFIDINRNGEIIYERSCFFSINDSVYYASSLKQKSIRVIPKLNFEYKKITYEVKNKSGLVQKGEIMNKQEINLEKGKYDLIFRIDLLNGTYRNVAKRLTVR